MSRFRRRHYYQKFLFQSPQGPLERKSDPFGSSSSNWDFEGDSQEQLYREEIRKTRQKTCSRGLCMPLNYHPNR